MLCNMSYTQELESLVFENSSVKNRFDINCLNMRIFGFQKNEKNCGKKLAQIFPNVTHLMNVGNMTAEIVVEFLKSYNDKQIREIQWGCIFMPETERIYKTLIENYPHIKMQCRRELNFICFFLTLDGPAI